MQVSKISLVFVRGNCTVVRDMDSGHLMLPANIYMVRNATIHQLVCTVFAQVYINMYMGTLYRHANSVNMNINPLFGSRNWYIKSCANCFLSGTFHNVQ